MKELFYFASADLLARVEYHHADNSLRYATHRKMTVAEQVMIDQYLLATFAPKTEYHRRQPAFFICLGTDRRLVKSLDQLHSANTRDELGEQAKDVGASVNDLIERAMQNYYFEQIGDAILEARREQAGVRAGFAAERRGQRRRKLEELVKAYNVYAPQAITLDAIVPVELKSYFGISAEDKALLGSPAVR